MAKSKQPPDRARGVLVLMSPAEFRKCEQVAGADGVMRWAKKLILEAVMETTGYEEKYHTGKPCIITGCNEPAGTAWSPLWCKQHDIERRERINKNLAEIAANWSAEANSTGGV